MSTISIQNIKEEFAAASNNGKKPMDGFEVITKYFPQIAATEIMQYQKDYYFGDRDVRTRELKNLQIQQRGQKIIVSALTKESWYSFAPRSGGTESKWVASAFVVDVQDTESKPEVLTGVVDLAHRWEAAKDNVKLFSAEKADVCFANDKPVLVLLSAQCAPLHTFGQ